MDKDQQLIWKFLDGDCTVLDVEEVEQRLALDEDFRRTMADARDLDNLLLARTAELPSLRFSKSVMEKVRDFGRHTLDYSLLTKRFAGWYFATVGSFLSVVLIIGFNLTALGGSLSKTHVIENAIRNYSNAPFASLFFQISIGMALLFALDGAIMSRYRSRTSVN